jgi:hypothetical protein
MNGIRITPRDRTMKRDEWKALNRVFRIAARETAPAVERAYVDAIATGQGFFRMTLGGKK